ncbi:hypothetical protein Tco_1284174 [Tanacetum coccineum]
MVVPLPFTVNLYHDGLFVVNLLEYIHFNSRVIDDVSFDGMSFKDFFATIRRLVIVSPTSTYYKLPSDPLTALNLLKNDEGICEFVKACYKNNLKIDLFTEHNGYDIMEMIHEDLHPKKPVGHVDSDSDGETNVPLDDVAHVVEQFEHENEGKKPKIVDDDECETRKQGSKKGDGRKAVSVTLSKAVKQRWNKKKKTKKKGSLNKVTIRLDVSLGQCKRAKQCALFNHEGGLVDHYSKLWQYRQAIFNTNRGYTYVLEIEVNDEDGKVYFSRFYVCFHGVKQGWLEGCRKIIGLDGCFLTHTCKGQLLTAMGRDANNQIFPIAWAVIGVENNVNRNGHKGLLQAVADWLPNAEHIECARRIYANFKKRWSGLQFKRLFWGVVATSMESVFLQKIKEIKMLDEKAHEWLVERNPNSWCRAFFEMDRCSAAFENDILEIFNSRILSGISCVHAMAGYMHMKMSPYFGVAEWQPPPLPPAERKMLGRPRKRRIRHPTEVDDHVLPRVGRVMHCHKCWENRHNKKTCPNQERPKPAYLSSKGIVFQEAPSSSMPPPTATPSTLNTMPPPPTPSSSNTMPPPSGSNIMPPPPGSNTMPPPPTPSGSNTMTSHATPCSNTSAGSNTMPSALTGTNKGKCLLNPKKEAGMPKVVLLAAELVLGVVQPAEVVLEVVLGVVLRVVQEKEVDVQVKEVEEHEFNMDMEAVSEIEKEQMAIDEDDQWFWEESAGKQPMIEDEPLQGGEDLPTQESTIKANPKPTRSKESKAAEVLNQ